MTLEQKIADLKKQRLDNNEWLSSRPIRIANKKAEFQRLRMMVQSAMSGIDDGVDVTVETVDYPLKFEGATEATFPGLSIAVLGHRIDLKPQVEPIMGFVSHAILENRTERRPDQITLYLAKAEDGTTIWKFKHSELEGITTPNANSPKTGNPWVPADVDTMKQAIARLLP